MDKRFALLIDADNVASKFIGSIMDELSNEGTITYKRIYGDWTRPDLGPWKKVLLNYSISPIQQYSYTSGKNSTDSAMIIDAMDILYAGKVDGFCIVSSDSDFTRIAARLRESGVYVIGMGEKKTPKPFIAACDKFKYLEVLAKAAAQAEQPAARPAAQEPHPQNHAAAPDTVSHAAAQQQQPSDTQSSQDTPQTPLKTIRKAIIAIVDEISDDDGWAPLSHIGNILLKRFPEFDVRNYGYLKLAKMMKSFNCFEIKAESSKEGNKLVYVRNLEGIK